MGMSNSLLCKIALDFKLYLESRIVRRAIRMCFLCVQKREKEFAEYLQEKMTQAKADFRELLKETKLITYKSLKMIDETDQHLKDIENVLQVCQLLAYLPYDGHLVVTACLSI